MKPGLLKERKHEAILKKKKKENLKATKKYSVKSGNMKIWWHSSMIMQRSLLTKYNKKRDGRLSLSLLQAISYRNH